MFEQRDVGLLGHPDFAHGLHLGLALGLVLQQLHLAREVAAVELGRHVLAQRLDIRPRQDLGADGRLQRDRILRENSDQLESSCGISNLYCQE